MQDKFKLTDEVIDAAVAQSKAMIPLPDQPGVPTARLKVVQQLLSNHIIHMRSEGTVATQLAADQQKVIAAGQVAQPATGVIDPQVATAQAQAADSIAPGDDRYPKV